MRTVSLPAGIAPDAARSLSAAGLAPVLEGGAAFEAGLNVNDLLLAVDGMRVGPATLEDRLDRTRGEPVDVTFFRGQALRSLRVRPRLQRLEEWSLLPVAEPDDRQRQAFKDWCGWDFPASTPSPAGEAGAAADPAPSAPPTPLPASSEPTESEGGG